MYIAFYFKAVAQYFYSSNKSKGPELNHDIRNIDLELSICLFLEKSYTVFHLLRIDMFFNPHKNYSLRNISQFLPFMNLDNSKFICLVIVFSKDDSKSELNMSLNSIYKELMKTIIKTAPKFFSNGTFLCPLGLCCIFPQEYLMLIDCVQYFIVPSKLNLFKSK